MNLAMKTKPKELARLEKILRAANAQVVVNTVDVAKDRDGPAALISFANLDSFDNCPELLYAAIQYAHLRGVAIRIAGHREATA